MLVETIKQLFAKWIYKKHIHDWIFQESKRYYQNIVWETERDVHVYRCACGEIKTVFPDTNE